MIYWWSPEWLAMGFTGQPERTFLSLKPDTLETLAKVVPTRRSQPLTVEMLVIMLMMMM